MDAPYTNYQTINRTVTESDLQRILFKEPHDGKFVRLIGTGELFGVASDFMWNRLVYGRENGNWIKSYGDNPGDYQIMWPSRISLDQDGNIFVLTNLPRSIWHFHYDESTELVSFVRDISLPGILQAEDFCTDYVNFNPGIFFCSFWIADKAGNAVFNYQDGTNIIKYTSVTDEATGEQISFVEPTSIIINYHGTSSMAIIDSNKKRIIIVNNYTFGANTIMGDVNALMFNDQLNVSLTSIGYFHDTGLWLSDENNGMFHIFDGYYGSGYLGSVRTLENGQTQWTNPKCLTSTYMSLSNGNSNEVITFDKWDYNSGINTYWPNVDCLNLRMFYSPLSPSISLPCAFILATIPTAAMHVWAQIYREDGTSEKLWVPYFAPGLYYPADQTIAAIKPSDLTNRIGKYRARFSLEPIDNQYYGNYQQPTKYYDIWFALPVNGTISEPVFGANNQITWNVNIDMGSGDFSYKWYRQDQGSSLWSEIQNVTSSSCTQPYSNVAFTIRCDITDNFTKCVTSLSKPLNVTVKSGPLTQNETWAGIIQVNGNVIVPNGINLTISNAIIAFNNNSSLVVKGV
jgi:hypothetical protein